MRDLFKLRETIKPVEYPEFAKFVDGIRHSYWVHTEYPIKSACDDYQQRLSPEQKSVAKRSMLAISQIEVSVKRFWGNLYNFLPKPEIEDVGGTFAECHVAGTEIMTPRGWVDFRDLKAGERVYQYDKENATYEVVVPSNILNESYSGDTYRVTNQMRDFHVTPNHNFYYKNKNKPAAGFVKRAVKDIVSFHSEMLLPLTGKAEGSVDELTAMDRLKIALQADGSERFWRNKADDKVPRGAAKGLRSYSISVKKSRKKDRLEALIASVGDLVSVRRFVNTEGYLTLEIDLPNEGWSYKSFDWVDLTDKSSTWCEAFIQELAEWDGTRLEGKGNSKNCLIRYSSVQKDCADLVQAIGYLAGYSAHVVLRQGSRKETYNDVFTVSFTKGVKYFSISSRPVKEHYEGTIHCVTVPSGMIITRYNGKVLISGNSEIRHKDAYSFCLDTLGLQDEFTDIHSVPAIAKRIEYLKVFMENAKRSKEDFTLTLILFSIFVEHISLFGQFLTMYSFSKYDGKMSGLANVISATSKEEELHGNFGLELFGILKKEHSELITPELLDNVRELASKALKAEEGILDWIFEKGDVENISKAQVLNYIKDRFNKSLTSLGVTFKPEVVDTNLLASTTWFDEEVALDKEPDFFVKRPVDYSIGVVSMTSSDLF